MKRDKNKNLLGSPRIGSKEALVLSIEDYIKKDRAAQKATKLKPTGDNIDLKNGQIINLDDFRPDASARESFLAAIQQLEETLAERILSAEKRSLELRDTD
jgi:hypothetical protein